MTLEDVDQRIIEALAHDGRCSFTDLAEQIGLSISAVHQRVRRLEQRGVISGYTARLNLDELGLPLAALVSLTPIDPSAPDDYATRMADIPQVQSCYSVAGDESYIVLVRVESPAALETLLGELRSTLQVTTRTTVVLSTPFENRPVFNQES